MNDTVASLTKLQFADLFLEFCHGPGSTYVRYVAMHFSLLILLNDIDILAGATLLCTFHISQYYNRCSGLPLNFSSAALPKG